MRNELNMPNKKGQEGFTFVEVLLSISLILVPSGLMMLGFSHFQATQQFTSSVAREVSRQIAKSGSFSEAQQTASEIADNYGIDATVTMNTANSFSGLSDSGENQLVVTIVSYDSANNVITNTADPVQRGGSVAVDVRMTTSLLPVPWIRDALSSTLSSRHSEVVDRYGSFDATP